MSEQHEKPPLVLKGGHVIDPISGTSARLDVTIAAGKIARVEKDISAQPDEKVIDVSDYYVTPGIVDIHVHCFPSQPGSDLSLPPQVNTFSSGVTTVADAGTTGWATFMDFKTQVIDKSKIRVLAFVNVLARGMGEHEQDPTEMQPRVAAALALRYPDVIVGIKTAHYGAPADEAHPPWAAVDAAIQAGELCHKPVMVDFSPRPDRPYPDLILEKLRPGDIHTHVFAQQFPIVDERGKLYDYMLRARERGVIFDLGHGGASFWFRNAVPAIQQGFVPDSISTDLHNGSFNGPMFDMQTCMSKMLSIGVPLEEVIFRSTVAPAREIGHPELGTLRVGVPADIAVFKLQEGTFPFVDCGRATYVGNQRLRCVMTIKDGDVVYNPLGLGLPKWEDAPPEYWGALGAGLWARAQEQRGRP